MLNNAPPVVKIRSSSTYFLPRDDGVEEVFNVRPFAGTYPGSPNFFPWQIITHMFMHGDIGHIFFNMFALYMFGGQLERLWGSQRFLNYYLICGLGGFVLHELWIGMELYNQYNSFFPQFTDLNEALDVHCMDGYDRKFGRVVGASGAVFGLLLAFGMLFPNTRLMLLFPPIPIKAKYFVLGYGVLELSLALENAPGDNVAHYAHLGGMLFGYMLLKRWQKERGTFY